MTQEQHNLIQGEKSNPFTSELPPEERALNAEHEPLRRLRDRLLSQISVLILTDECLGSPKAAVEAMGYALGRYIDESSKGSLNQEQWGHLDQIAGSLVDFPFPLEAPATEL